MVYDRDSNPPSDRGQPPNRPTRLFYIFFDGFMLMISDELGTTDDSVTGLTAFVYQVL